LDAVEIGVGQIRQLSAILFDKMTYDLMPKYFKLLCDKIYIIVDTTFPQKLYMCNKTDFQ